MSEVLVLVDHVDGTVRKSTLELLTIARRLGEPAAVFIGSGVDTAREALAQYGAEKIYLVDSAEVSRLPGRAQGRGAGPAGGLGLAGRGADLVLDRGQGDRRPAVDQDRLRPDHRRRRRPGRPDGVQTTQSVFAGSYTVTATVTKGTPIIMVKPNSATPEAAAGAAAEQAVEVSVSEGARAPGSPTASPARRPAGPA